MDPESFCYFFDNLDRSVGALSVRMPYLSCEVGLLFLERVDSAVFCVVSMLASIAIVDCELPTIFARSSLVRHIHYFSS
jgi:hypothetical protein